VPVLPEVVCPRPAGHRTLSQAQFRQLCEDCGDIRSPDSLLDYLHQLGMVFYQPGLFLDAIILDQSWALETVYATSRETAMWPLW
jgi:hypothetical protein